MTTLTDDQRQAQMPPEQRDGLVPREQLPVVGQIAAATVAQVSTGDPFDQTTDLGPVVSEEIFGPVLTIMPYDDEDDAVRIADDTAPKAIRL